MNGERKSAVDGFLDELGRAPVPADLPRMVMSQVRKHPGRRGRPRLQIAFAAAGIAALAVAVFVVGSERFISPPRQSGPTPTTAATTDSPTESPGSTPGETPTSAPPITGSWDLMMPLFQDRFGRLQVADESGRLVGARLADGFPGGPGPDDPFALDIRRVPGNTREVFVGWTGGGCDFRGRLLLDRSGKTLTLQFAPRPGCDAIGIGRGVILEFAVEVDATAMTGRQSREPLVALEGFVPLAIAFADRNVGWIGGTNPEADALVLHTVDGGATWTTSGLGEGQVTEIAAIDGQHAFATLECAEHQFGCSSGTFRWDEDFGGWGKATSDRLVRIDFSGEHGVAVALPPEDEAPIVPALRLNDDGGDTEWTPLDDPCPGETSLSDAERISLQDILVLCLAEAGTGGTFKWLFASGDVGATWAERASTEGSGLFMGGTPNGFAMVGDGSGWIWGSRMPLLHTTDAGASWSNLDVADGDVRIVNDASYLGQGAGFAIVQDPDRQAILLLWTRDGQTWEELRNWPLR